MNIIAVLLVLFSAVIHALRNFITKKSPDKQAFVWCYEFAGLILFAPLFIYFFLTEGFGTKIGITIGIISGIIHTFYWSFHAKAYEDGDLSYVYPIMRSAPAFVLVFAVIFLKEQVSITGVLGILAIVFGVYIINMKKITLRSLYKPLMINKKRATQFAFLTLITVIAYSIVDKLGVGQVHPVVYTSYYSFFGFVLLTPYIFTIRKKSEVYNVWLSNKKAVILNGFFAVIGYIPILIALTFEKVSYVVGLRQSSVIIAVLLGNHILREEQKLIRITAGILIFIGSFLISIAS